MQRTEQTTGPQPVAAGVPARHRMRPTRRRCRSIRSRPRRRRAAKTESGTYGASKTVRHMVESPGRVRRLTAAIVVNDRLMQAAAKDKAAVWQPRSADELRNLTALAQAAVGFDSARGDVLTVQDLAFDENRAAPPVSAVSRVLSDGGELAGAGQVRRAAAGPAGGAGLWRAPGAAPRGTAPAERQAAGNARRELAAATAAGGSEAARAAGG